MTAASIQVIHDFIRHLLSAVANATLYGMKHQQVARLSRLTFEGAIQVLRTRPDFSLLVVENELIIDDAPQDLGLFMGRFTQILTSHGISHIRISEGVSPAEIEALITALACSGKTPGPVASSDHIRLGTVSVRSDLHDDLQDGTQTSPHESLHYLPERELEQFKELYESIKQQQKLKINGMIEVVSGFVNAFRQEGRPLLVMAAMRDVDEYTFTHSTNVCILNLAQATALGIEGQQLNDIGVAAMLHDIGKLFVPEEILTKQDKLTDQEFAIMKQHPVKGARYLMDTPGAPRLAAITAFEHHMKYDFSGYPAVPGDWQQNLCSQMTAISDFFDALRTRRPYREPMELREIAGIMLGMMGRELHPQLTRNFLRIISRVMPDPPQ